MARAKLWNTEKLIETFEEAAFSEYLEQGIELLKKQRIVDFIITPGRVSAKHIDDLGNANKLEILIDTFSDEDWFTLILKLSLESIYLAHFLCGNIPLKLEGICEELGISLFPEKIEQIEMRYQGKIQKQASAPLAAVIHKLAEKLRDEHFLLFLLRGKGSEEIIASLKQRRNRISETRRFDSPTRYQQLQHVDAAKLSETIDSFWEAGAELKTLQFSIKADELPASILKRLDPLPLGGIEDEIEHQLEEAYVQIARRAQGYGLGMES